MSGAHRRLRLVHGRVITKRRWRMIRDYVQRHGPLRNNIALTDQRYIDWVKGFERFLIYGLRAEAAQKDHAQQDHAQQDREQLPRHEVRLAIPDDARAAQADQGSI